MANYYDDNSELRFHLTNLGLEKAVALRERNYAQAATCPNAPSDFAAAMGAYEEKLRALGALCGGPITERAVEVDQVGAQFKDGKVILAPGTVENLEDIRKLGLCGVTLPREYGGLNFPVTVYSMMTEMVSRADASLQNLFGLQSIAQTICNFGSEEQKARFLPGFATGENDGAMALTEPDAGSDLQSAQLSARYDEARGVWLLNGIKHFITNGCSKVILVLARSEEGSKDGRGLSMFIAERCPQIRIHRIENKMGIHGSPTCELHFEDAPAQLVGQRRRGLTRYVMSLMNGARMAISSQAVGLAEAARRTAWEYTSKRIQFGKPLCEIPAVNEMLTRMDALTVAGRTLLYEACKYVDLRDACNAAVENGDDTLREEAKELGHLTDLLTPMTKAFNTEMANKVAYDGIQCHGGKGYMREHNAERYYRDARIMNIYEGTTQMQFVAAKGGIVKRVLKPLLDELEALPFTGEAAELARRVAKARQCSDETIAAELANNASEGRLDFIGSHLVRMETLVFVSYLLLRDTLKDSARLPLAKRFIWEFLPEVAYQAELVKTWL